MGQSHNFVLLPFTNRDPLCCYWVHVYVAYMLLNVTNFNILLVYVT